MLKNLIPPKYINNNKKPYRKLKAIETTDFIEHQSYKIISLVGYIIVGLTFFEYLHLVIPTHFFNPSWELETIGKLVETIWILLLGLGMIFFRPQKKSVKQSELRIMAFFSWITLIFALICFLSAPLVISNALRINQSAKAKINTQLVYRETQMEQALFQVENSSEKEIITLLKSNQVWNSSRDAEDAKTQLINFLQDKNQTAIQELKQTLKSTQLKLLKTAFKLFINAIVCGIALVAMWRYTTWTRKIKL